jgi:hypothetical protein
LIWNIDYSIVISSFLTINRYGPQLSQETVTEIIPNLSPKEATRIQSLLDEAGFCMRDDYGIYRVTPGYRITVQIRSDADRDRLKEAGVLDG